MTFQQAVKRELKSRGMSPKSFAHRMDMHHSMIYKYVHGVSTPTLGTAQVIAKELGIKLDKLDISGKVPIVKGKAIRKRARIAKLRKQLKAIGES